jgi:hypothetical protein
MRSTRHEREELTVRESISDTVRLGVDETDTVRFEPAQDPGLPIYYLLWRARPSLPWHSEEVESRPAAHRRYFALLERGVEVYLERRWKSYLPA